MTKGLHNEVVPETTNKGDDLSGLVAHRYCVHNIIVFIIVQRFL